jgi:hypothetical protein
MTTNWSKEDVGKKIRVLTQGSWTPINYEIVYVDSMSPFPLYVLNSKGIYVLNIRRTDERKEKKFRTPGDWYFTD